jgi:hypothetical protein
MTAAAIEIGLLLTSRLQESVTLLFTNVNYKN